MLLWREEVGLTEEVGFGTAAGAELADAGGIIGLKPGGLIDVGLGSGGTTGSSGFTHHSFRRESVTSPGGTSLFPGGASMGAPSPLLEGTGLRFRLTEVWP